MRLVKILKMPPKPKRSAEPLWKGPTEDGVTQSLLGRYLADLERFRLLVIEGLTGQERWNAPTGYGDMWHAAEEEFARTKGSDDNWQRALLQSAKQACASYPLQQAEISDWYEKAKVQFPVYIKHWEQHPDVKDRVPMFQEHQFDTKYTLPSERVVRIRGKRDAVDLINGGVYVGENKSKSRVDDARIARQLTRDLQTMIYVITLREDFAKLEPKWQKYAGKVRGVRYNVVKRPSHKILKNLQEALAEKPEEFFARWLVEITNTDVQRFKTECLHPILENLCDDYEWWAFCKSTGNSPFDYQMREQTYAEHRHRHFLLPFGIYNITAEGGVSDLDEFILSGSMAGLSRATSLFKELECQ
jgi:hypothetical protein